MKPVERRFTMPIDALKVAIGAVRLAASLDSTREHMHSVHIEREGAQLRFVATNGHWMAVYSIMASDADGDPCEWGATLALPDAIAIMKRKSFGEVVVDFDAKVATFVDGTMKLNVVECQYPPWREVFAKEENKEARATIGLNPRYVGLIAESFDAILGKPKKNEHVVCIEPGIDLGPIRITCPEAPQLEIILAPAKQPPTPWTLGKRKESIAKAV